MSTLVIQIPERLRLRARGAGAAEPGAQSPGGEYDHVLSPDGLVVQIATRCAPRSSRAKRAITAPWKGSMKQVRKT